MGRGNTSTLSIEVFRCDWSHIASFLLYLFSLKKVSFIEHHLLTGMVGLFCFVHKLGM